MLHVQMEVSNFLHLECHTKTLLKSI